MHQIEIASDYQSEHTHNGIREQEEMAISGALIRGREHLPFLGIPNLPRPLVPTGEQTREPASTCRGRRDARPLSRT